MNSVTRYCAIYTVLWNSRRKWSEMPFCLVDSIHSVMNVSRWVRVLITMYFHISWSVCIWVHAILLHIVSLVLDWPVFHAHHTFIITPRPIIGVFRGAMVRPPPQSDHEFLDNFCTVFVNFVISRLGTEKWFFGGRCPAPPPHPTLLDTTAHRPLLTEILNMPLRRIVSWKPVDCWSGMQLDAVSGSERSV